MDSLNSCLNPSLLSTVPCFNQSHADSIISSLLSFPDSSSISIASSFDRVLDKALTSVSDDDSVQDRLVDRTIELASLLLESTKRCYRKRASVQNSRSWFLPPELTIKVFVCACRSLKIGSLVRQDGCEPTAASLSGSCLSPLSFNHGFLGSRLRCLWLCNIRPLKYNDLCDAVSFCSNITDLRIVGLYSPSELFFKSLAKCRLIENLFLENSDFHGTLGLNTGSALIEFMSNCLNLSSLTLIGFGVSSETSRNLAEGSRKLKYMNFSRSPTLNGRFLRDLGHSCIDGPLKTLILRNCPSLEEKEVLEFCNSLLAGDFKSIRHIDVSNNRGLVSHGKKRSMKPNFPLEKLKKERPGVTFVADFPSTSYRACNEAEEEELKWIEKMEAQDDGDWCLGLPDDSEDDSYDSEADYDTDETVFQS